MSGFSIVVGLVASTTLVLAMSLATVAAEAAGEAADTLAGYVSAPKVFRAAMDKVLPAVVRIETSGGVLAPVAAPRPAAKPTTPDPGKPVPGKPAPGRPPRHGTGGVNAPGDGPTTGLLISSDGYIITSTYNFLRRPPIITVVLSDGSQHVAKLLGRDETRKLCLLKIDDVKGLPAPQAASASALRVGQWAVAVGMGYGGDEASLSTGIISAVQRISGRAVQTDAKISPANYGGPLVDLDGRVIGVCVPLSPSSEETAAGAEWYDSGIGFAVPLDGLDRVVQDLKEGKVIQHGKMGVTVKLGASQKGVEIASVAVGSPAAKAGLKAKDLITAVNGQMVDDARSLRILMGRYVAGQSIKVATKRGDKTIEVELTLIAGIDVPPPSPIMPLDVKPLPKGKE